MATIVQDTRFELAAHELVVLADAAGHELVCAAGELWVTIDGDRRDIVLARGESFRITGAAAVVVSAFKAATLSVRRTQTATPAVGAARRLLAPLLHWTTPPLAALPPNLSHERLPA